MSRRSAALEGRIWNPRRARWQHWREAREFDQERARPAPVKILVENGVPVEGERFVSAPPLVGDPRNPPPW